MYVHSLSKDLIARSPAELSHAVLSVLLHSLRIYDQEISHFNLTIYTFANIYMYTRSNCTRVRMSFDCVAHYKLLLLYIPGLQRSLVQLGIEKEKIVLFGFSVSSLDLFIFFYLFNPPPFHLSRLFPTLRPAELSGATRACCTNPNSVYTALLSTRLAVRYFNRIEEIVAEEGELSRFCHLY